MAAFLIAGVSFWLLFSFIENRMLNPLSILGSYETKETLMWRITDYSGKVIEQSKPPMVYYDVNVDGRFFLLLLIAASTSYGVIKLKEKKKLLV